MNSNNKRPLGMISFFFVGEGCVSVSIEVDTVFGRFRPLMLKGQVLNGSGEGW